MQPPKNTNQVWAFLGFVGYYQTFIKNFAQITKQLMTLMHHDAKFEWTPNHQAAFISQEGVLIEVPILHLPSSFKMIHSLNRCLWWCLWCSAITGTQWQGTTSCISLTYIHGHSKKREHSWTRWCLFCHYKMQLLPTGICLDQLQWPQTLTEVS